MVTYTWTADINQFNATTTRYSGENALLLADCANLVYENAEVIRSALAAKGLNQFEFFSGSSTQAFIAGNTTIIIVAFRGTELKESADVKADLWVEPVAAGVPEIIGKVHNGFNDALHEVWGTQAKSDMRTTLKQFHNINQSIWFCGHSLGAALAMLAAAEFAVHDNGFINGLYTIGQPRVGNAKYAAHFDQILGNRCFRFANNNDVVPLVPLWEPVWNYTHSGKLIYFDNQGQLKDSISWMQRIIDRTKGLSNDFGKLGLKGLKDHSAAGYVSLIAKNRKVPTQWS